MFALSDTTLIRTRTVLLSPLTPELTPLCCDKAGLAKAVIPKLGSIILIGIDKYINSCGLNFGKYDLVNLFSVFPEH